MENEDEKVEKNKNDEDKMNKLLKRRNMILEIVFIARNMKYNCGLMIILKILILMIIIKVLTENKTFGV